MSDTSKIESSPGRYTLVPELMSTSPVIVDTGLTAQVALQIARDKGVHCLLVAEGFALRRIVCICDLERGGTSATLGSLGSSVLVCVNTATSLAAAAKMMLACGVGCLPVLSDAGLLTGIITRRDLREHGFLPNEQGVDLCTTCGASHHLRALGGDAGVVFCSSCLADTPGVGDPDSANFTLGGDG